MRISRRHILPIVAAGAFARPALALDYPTRPVKIIVGQPPGGAPDLTARLAAQFLAERLGQPFLVENRAGAGGNIAAEAAIRAPADGYTLLLLGTPNLINALLYEKLNLDFTRDLMPVATLTGNSPFVMVVNPSFPAKTIPEFIAYAKANPGVINMASTGSGNMSHMAGELFKMLAGVDLLHVPFRGEAPAQGEVLSGRAHVMFDVLSAALQYVNAGLLRALGVSTAARSPALPDVPSIGEFTPGYEMSATSGMAAPRGTPPDIIALLNRELNAGLADPRIGGRIAEVGSPVLAGTPEDFGALIARQKQKWAEVIKFAGIKPE